PDATIAALKSFERLVLIVGGSSKGLAWKELGVAIASHPPKALLTVGTTGPEIAAAAIEAGFPAQRVQAAHTLAQAVSQAAELATSGDTVVLSPASASFDQFRNVSDRGEQFKALVQRLDE